MPIENLNSYIDQLMNCGAYGKFIYIELTVF